MTANPATVAVWDASLLPGSDVCLPLGLIEEAVRRSGCQERRRRLLPAAAVMVFVLGLCLFCGEGYAEVARKLAAWLSGLAGRACWHLPGTSALAKARARLGSAPFELLFSELAGPLATASVPGAAEFGRLLVALDGTRLDVPFTPANVAAFGPPQSAGQGRHAGGFPQVRLVTLTGCGTHGIADAAFGPRKGSSEQHLAKAIAGRGALAPGMLVIADRAFCGYPVVSALTATGADVLIRAKSSQWLPVAQALPDGSYRSVLPSPAAARARHTRNAMRRARGSKLGPDTGPVPGIPVRVIEADITITPGHGQPRTERCRLITTLASPAQAPAAHLAACYAQRWEIETSYREIKIFTRGPGRVLRSQHPAGITQEIWALLCACQLTHTARARAAAAGGHDPDRISYTVTLRAIRRALITASNPATITAEALDSLLPPHRRHRSCPRLTHTSTAKRRAARARHTRPTTYKITITAPAHTPHLPSP